MRLEYRLWFAGCKRSLSGRAVEAVVKSENSHIDPICGMTVDPERAAGRFEHDGENYYFCSTHCLQKFSANPSSFISKESTPAVIAPLAAGAAGQEYTCPMHPEIVRQGPDSCPICGMALEPRTISLDEPENPELADMQRRFWISLVLTAPVFLLAMSEMLPGQPVQHAIGYKHSYYHPAGVIDTCSLMVWLAVF